MMADTTDLIMRAQYHEKRRIGSIPGIPVLWEVTAKRS